MTTFDMPPGACVRRLPTRRGDDSKDAVWKIQIPHFLPSGPEIADRVGAVRKARAADRDDFLALQKACGARGDRDGARFFKEAAGDALKEYRAACLVLPLLEANPPGDCPCRPEWEWPVELAPWVDRIIWEMSR